MRPSRIVPCLALVALLAGCENDLEGPTTDGLASPQFGATRMEMVTPQVNPRGTHYIACANDGAGEDLYFEGPWWAHWSIIITPSGNHMIQVARIVYGEDFKATGAEDVWMIDADKSGGNATFSFLAGTVLHLNVNEFYTNQDGENLHIQFVMHIVFDENFEPRMWIDTGWCPGQG